MPKILTDQKPDHDHPANQDAHRISRHTEFESDLSPKRHHSNSRHHEMDNGESGHRNFWREWRDERHHHGHDMDIPIGQALSPKEMDAWREFFHTSFGSWPEQHWLFGGRRFSPWHQGIESFNPFVASLLSKGGGLLPLYILHLVAQKPLYGNEIMDLLEERTNGQWVSNPGAIYPLMTLLEREGFVTGEWEDPDKRTIRVYTITSTGLDEVHRIKTIVSPKIEETIQVLQILFQDLQDQPADTAKGMENGEQNNNEVIQ
jgi:DNA-binding PadR family transcriptional regulator